MSGQKFELYHQKILEIGTNVGNKANSKIMFPTKRNIVIKYSLSNQLVTIQIILQMLCKKDEKYFVISII